MYDHALAGERLLDPHFIWAGRKKRGIAEQKAITDLVAIPERLCGNQGGLVPSDDHNVIAVRWRCFQGNEKRQEKEPLVTR